jgi:diguanylate cyclase (GGDEF)-like protein/PAS domain S-box-containing protein
MTSSLPPTLPFPEDRRIQALQDLNILDTPEEYEYDQLVHLASQICGTPISLVSLVDKTRQWFKASVGLAARETPRSVSFCSHAIQQPDLFVIEDATSDARFQDNALVTHGPKIRFYAGMPIHAPSGAPIGTLCVIDTQARTLHPDQRMALIILGQQVQARMDLRAQKSALEQALEENRRLSESLQASNKMFEAFMNNGPFIGFIKDAAGRFLFYNAPLAKRFGVNGQEWIGKSDHDLFPSEFADTYRQNDLDVMASGVLAEVPEVTTSPEGQLVHWKSFKFPLASPSGESMLAGMSLDVTEDLARQEALALANAELERLATIDPLTGLHNRRFFQTRIESEFTAEFGDRRLLTLMLMDVDNFKRRNDEQGHAAGDQALAFLGKVLRESIRSTDTAVRLGGEEFALLLPSIDHVQAARLGARIQAALRNAPSAPEDLTVSIGIASTADNTRSWDQLFSLADKAMYHSKTHGKNRVTVAPQLLARREIAV